MESIILRHAVAFNCAVSRFFNIYTGDFLFWRNDLNKNPNFP